MEGCPPYATGCRAQLDVEDIDFDIYKKARELMESSGMSLAHEHVRRDEFYLSTYLLLSIYMSMPPTPENKEP